MDYSIKVIAIGVAASRCVRKMMEHPLTNVEYCIVSADETDLDLNNSNVRSIGLVPNCSPHIIDSYGSNMWFNQCFVNWENEVKVKSIINQSAKQVVIVVGFGGGIGTSGTIWIAEISKKQNIPVTVVCTLPFGFEGERKRQRALDAVKSLEEIGIAVKVLYAEDLWKMNEGLDLYNCFVFLDEYVTDTVASMLLRR